MRFLTPIAIGLFIGSAGAAIVDEATSRNQYIISNIHQIKPNVLKQIEKPSVFNLEVTPRGATGEAGPQGPRGGIGETGGQGQPGEKGERGKEGGEAFFTHICNALRERELNLSHEISILSGLVGVPVGVTGMPDRREVELFARELTLTAVSKLEAESNC